MTDTSASATQKHSAAGIGSMQLAFEVLLWRKGLLWALSGALSIGVAVIAVLDILPTRHRLIETQSQVDFLAAQISNQDSRSADGSHRSAAQRLNMKLTEVLPVGSQAADDIRSLYKLADRHGISIQRADFTTSEDTRIGVARVQIVTPLVTTYPRLRQFIEAFLLSTPYATLDQIAFQRESISQNEVKAKLRVSWWLDATSAKKTDNKTEERAP